MVYYLMTIDLEEELGVSGTGTSTNFARLGIMEIWRVLDSMRDASQIAFFRAEMTVKFHLERGPFRVPPRARRIPASHANVLKPADTLGARLICPVWCAPPGNF